MHLVHMYVFVFRFRIDNTDHVFGVKIRDRVNIKCPNYDPSTVFDPNQVEYSEIYNVS